MLGKAPKQIEVLILLVYLFKNHFLNNIKIGKKEEDIYQI